MIKWVSLAQPTLALSQRAFFKARQAKIHWNAASTGALVVGTSPDPIAHVATEKARPPSPAPP